MSNFVLAIPADGLVKRVVVPSGLKMPITAVLWGAGGGGGGNDGAYVGGNGAGGQAVKVTFNAAVGDVIDFGIGAGGGAGGSYSGSAAGGSPGSAYIDNSLNRYKGGKGGNAGSSGSSGGGGAGGGASVLSLNGTVIAVAGGGGGGGGSGNTGLFATGPSDYGTPSGWIAVTGASTWCAFMKTYAIWKGALEEVGTKTFTTTFYAPATGTYTSEISVDNSATVTIDGTPLNTINFTKSITTKGSLNIGVHTIAVSVKNDSGSSYNPAGIAMTIKDSNGNIVWDTRSWAAGTYSYSYSLPGGKLGGDDAVATSTPGSSVTGAAGTNKSGDGGGGGGGGGGKNGGTGGGTRSGDQGGYPGGTGASWRHPTLTLSGETFAGTGTQPPTVDVYTVTPSHGVGGTARNNGRDGYAILLVESTPLPYLKDNGSWTPVTAAYVKVSDQWRDVTKVYVKVNGAWKDLGQSSSVTIASLSNGVNYG